MGLGFLTILVFAGIAFLMLPLPGSIPVLMYHFIDTPERAAVEKNVVSRASFEKQMRFLSSFGYRVITLDEYDEIRRGLRKPKGKEIVITFDDANYTFADQAFPILAQYGFPVTVFAVSDNVKNHLHGSMTEETLSELLKSGHVFLGSHSKSHPLLPRLSEEEIRQELQGSKQELEDMLGVKIQDLAYPSGDIDPRVLDIAKASGYRMAFTTSYKKLNGLPESEYAITRVKITRTSDLLLAYWLKLSGIYQIFKRESQDQSQPKQDSYRM